MSLFTREDVRNVAIIAHVDHGKTTLVDGMLKQSGVFRENQNVAERVMDSNDLEKERGITILAKNTSVHYNGKKINIIDTPGHADFGGEVERVLKMVDGVLLIVDAFEGPMPQTKFVLKKALELDLKPVVVINKIDRPDARPYEVIDEVLELFIELNADDDQLEFPVVYASAKEGIATVDLSEESSNIYPLFETIISHVPSPSGSIDETLQIVVTSIEYDEYIGRIGIGKIIRGKVNNGQNISVCGKEKIRKAKVGKLYTYEGLKRVEIKEALLGEIVAISGIEDISIGETIADYEQPESLPFVDIDEPTISMTFSVNNGPFAGLEGQYVTSRHLRARLFKELETNVSLRVEETEAADTFKVSGRGELHLSVLIETMRRQGYEFLVSKPSVIYKYVDSVKMEPIELLYIDIPEEYMGTVMEKIGIRKGEMINMTPSNSGYMRLEFKIPARGLIGYRSEFMTDTKGNGILNHLFHGFDEYKGDIDSRTRGSLVAFEDGEATTYGLYNAQDRGELFIGPGTRVYTGMIVGENARGGDIDVNVCKKKHVTNMRASGSDEALRLTPHRIMSLEQCLEFIGNDEQVEITPKTIRLRKIILDSRDRQRAAKRQEG